MNKLLFACALLAVPACVFRVGGGDGMHFGHSSTTTDVGGHHVEASDDAVSVDGVELTHVRWVDATLDAEPGQSLHVATANGPIELQGVAGQGRFRARLWSELEDDGDVAIENGELVAKGRGKVLIDEVRGTLPAGVALRVSSGSGNIELRAFTGAPGLDANSGTGEIRLQDCSGTLRVRSGTGNVSVKAGAGPELNVESGTGDIACTAATFDQVHLSSGTGDLTVEGCGIKRLQADSGTGDAIIRGGKIDELHHNLGVGQLVYR